MARTANPTPAQGSTAWYAWANQLNTEHEALFGTSGITDTSDRDQVRANLGVSRTADVITWDGTGSPPTRTAGAGTVTWVAPYMPSTAATGDILIRS